MPVEYGRLINITSIGRSCEIYSRLRDISNGKAPEILKEVDARERDMKTWCVGVKWDYTLEQLLQLSEV